MDVDVECVVLGVDVVVVVGVEVGVVVDVWTITALFPQPPADRTIDKTMLATSARVKARLRAASLF